MFHVDGPRAPIRKNPPDGRFKLIDAKDPMHAAIQRDNGDGYVTVSTDHARAWAIVNATGDKNPLAP